MKFSELAPCGVYCGACPSFNKTCKGCASEDKEQDRCSKWNCKIRNCCYNQKGIDYCIHCEQFPCRIIHRKLLDPHPGEKKFTYRHEIPEVFTPLKTMKVENYRNMQFLRWRCDSCGGTIRFYTYRCDTCGKEKMI